MGRSGSPSRRRVRAGKRARVTIADVASAAGVSAMTVSRVVNRNGRVSEHTRRRIRKAIETLGYEPNVLARSLTQGQSKTLGVVVPDITNPFFSEVVRGAEDAAWEAGYTVALANAVEDPVRERSAIRNFAGHMVDGVILCSPRLPDAELRELLAAHDRAVLVNRRLSDSDAISVMVDDFHGAQLAVRHLLAAGRRRLLLLGGPERSASAEARRAGFLHELAAAGLTPDDSLLLRCEPVEESGHEAVAGLLGRADGAAFDAIVAYNDLVAVGAGQALAAVGLDVPTDVAIIGCDDIRLASAVSPGLTTLRIDKYRLGRAASASIFALIRDEPLPDSVFGPELVVRASAP